MPWKAKKSCMHPGCRATYEGQGSYCDAHKSEHSAGKAYNAYGRDKDRQAFETSARWRKIRRAALARAPLCADCLAVRRVTMANEVHHVDDDYTNNEDSNLMCLCTSCHSKRTRKGE